MAGRQRNSTPEELGVAPSDRPFYLFGSDGRRAVRCRTRWMTDKFAYVVAPLATATAVRQRWHASTSTPQTPRQDAPAGGFSVELISAETLLGSDSGNEGLLLRFLAPKAPPVSSSTAQISQSGQWDSANWQPSVGA